MSKLAKTSEPSIRRRIIRDRPPYLAVIVQRAVVIALVFGVLAMAGTACSSSSSNGCNARCQAVRSENASYLASLSQRAAPESKQAAGGALPDDSLTGIGATTAAWNSAHQADTTHGLDEGCCYGPTLKIYGQTALSDTWVSVQSDKRIYMLQHNFSPGTPAAEAQQQVESADLPADAKLLRSKVGDGCKLFLYRSARIGAVAETSYISVFFVSPPDQTVYHPNNIWYAGVSSNSENDLGTC